MFAGVSYDRLEGHGLQWPVPDRSHGGTAIMHVDRFPRGRAKFAAVEYLPSGEQPDSEYPFVLVTGRVLQHYNAGTMTRRTGLARVVDRDWLEIHPDDARDCGLKDGRPAQVVSRHGTVPPCRTFQRSRRSRHTLHELSFPAGGRELPLFVFIRPAHSLPGVQGAGGGHQSRGGDAMNRAGPVSSASVIRCTGGQRQAFSDHIAAEEPLEIRLGKQRVTVLMRTPGNDVDLATGFLLTEGLIAHPDEIVSVDYCPNVGDSERGNVLVVLPEPKRSIATQHRAFYASASCGICGKTGIETVALNARATDTAITIDLPTLISLPGKLRASQPAFDQTGGLQAAGLFAADGQLLCAREDIGRHNAVDKAIGALAAAGRFPFNDVVLLVSGRASFEICQKAAMAGIGLVASISAPSSLAIELARG